MKSIIIATCITLAFLSGGLAADHDSLDSYDVVKLHYGENRVDFNNDGVEDLIVLAKRENFNAHGFDVVSFYANESQSSKEPLGVVSIFDQNKENLTLEVSGGADCVLHDFRLLKSKHGKGALLIVADRIMSDSYFENNSVSFKYFRLEANPEGVVGRPSLYFSLSEVRQAKLKYCDVNEAFRSELGLENYLVRDE
jgi:hypothetical protein